MKSTQLVVAAVLFGASFATFADSQSPEIGRTELMRRDLGDPGREVIQVRVDFSRGAAFPRHSHPGVEVAFVLEGSLEYQFDGKPPVTLKAGESLFIPAGAIHSAKNVDEGRSSELATYIVEKARPLVKTAP
ncbi:cupin domain-containing protein [Variovorax sp. J31P207]|uniref:cupin domain-containing protein n=1 Tax=Variovorax sp. J31P207 TaxID=3053510 RepID=UPI002578FE28|nr:cupin domain-containing protein [Variovorax sp. J31P207]MDM0069984.1 cupin domain-containing protein [Variovorax sp. J31P207]